MVCTVVVGGFFGDEGKGKVISYLSLKDGLDVSVRGGVGPNAGHSFEWKGKIYRMRMLTSAFVSPKTRLLIGPGVLVNPNIFLREVEEVNAKNRSGLDPLCAIIEQEHIEQDRSSEHLSQKIGTTGTGCGPCNVDRIRRVAKMAREVPELKDFLTDVPLEVNEAVDGGKKVLLEGTQGTFLSLFHGTYPYVTSKDITASSIAADVGLGPKKVDEVIIVFKAFVTRVGSGPLEGELSREEIERRGWSETATVTGRSRRAAPFDYDLAKRSIMLNGATQIALTKFDVVFPGCKGIKSFNRISKEGVEFIHRIEEETSLPVTLIGTGSSVEDIIDRRRN